MSVRSRDNGAKALLKAVSKSPGPSVDVGVLGAEAGAQVPGESEEPVTVGQVAEWAEYGLGQPERSWLRAWIDEHQAEIHAMMRAGSDAVIRGEQTREQAMGILGAWITGQIQLRIAAGIMPANAESTIERKGSSTPLINTGQLRSSIANRVNK